MDITPEGLPDKLYWRRARGRVALLHEARPGPRIYLTLPPPRNFIRAGAANCPARGSPALQLVRWPGNGAAGMGRLIICLTRMPHRYRIAAPPHYGVRVPNSLRGP
jgi:hypothetical protein